jgi:hypothetical protein
MRKQQVKLIIIAFIALAAALALFACNSKPVILTIDGDIEGGIAETDLAKLKAVKFSYDDDGETVEAKGYGLSGILEGIKMLYPDNKIMITASDGVSAVVRYPLTSDIYIYINDNGAVCAKGIGYPKVVGIKDIAEITVITQNEATEGYRIVSPLSDTVFVSRGNAKLRLFDFIAENHLGENIAEKYEKGKGFAVSDFTDKVKNAVYFEDYDILPDAGGAPLDWKGGKLVCKTGEEYKPVFGFAVNADKLILDAFADMKNALDGGKKVMFILPDGFSLQQAEHFKDYLTTLKMGDNTAIAASTNLSISPVALAAIVTGQSPFVNGVHFDKGESRAVLPVKVDDIFKYAENQGKSVSYIEGKGNLIITSVNDKVTYSVSDQRAYQNGIKAINDGADLIFIHFHEIDDVNHSDGPLSDEAKDKILEIEGYIEDLISRFDGTVIIVPDHGHNTLYDAGGNAYGAHGLFTSLDMFVPYYVFEG